MSEKWVQWFRLEMTSEKKLALQYMCAEKKISSSELIKELLDKELKDYFPMEWRVVRQEHINMMDEYYLMKIKFVDGKPEETEDYLADHTDFDSFDELRDYVTKWHSALSKPVMKMDIGGEIT